MTPGLPPLLTIDGAIARISLRRPRHANRLEIEDLETLQAHFAAVNAQEEVRVLLIQAEGKHFCSGFHIDAVPGVDAGALFGQMTDALERIRPLTVAAIQGGVFGGATDLALACDFRLGTAQCRAFIPAAKLGLHYFPGGMRRLVSRLGLNWAKRLLLGADTLDAEALLHAGFLEALHADADALQAAAEAHCQHLATLAPLAVQGMKRHLNAAASVGWDAAALQRDIAQCNASQDLSEGVRAWQAQRPPVFIGR